MKVSVVIPVHNVERYIGGCIESVLSQTYQDFEVIIVDDCTQDNSIRIVESYESEKIKIVRHDKNKGLSAARNTGVSHCSGNYLLFLDSDDTLKPEALEKCIAVIKSHGSDIVSFNSQHIDDSGRTWPVTWHQRFNFSDMYNLSIAQHPKLVWDVAAWNKLIDLNFYRSNGFAFDEGQRWFEDHLFSLELYTNTEKISIVHDVLHHYTKRDGQITQARCFDLVHYRLRMINSVTSYLRESGNAYLSPYFFELVFSFYKRVLNDAYDLAGSKDLFFEVIQEFKQLLCRQKSSIFSRHHIETVDLALCLKYMELEQVCDYFKGVKRRIDTMRSLMLVGFPEKDSYELDFSRYVRHYSYTAADHKKWYLYLAFCLTQPLYLASRRIFSTNLFGSLVSKNIGIFHIARSGLFDENYYSKLANRKFGSRRAAITHYVYEGESMGLQPNSYFSAGAYVRANPDLVRWKGSLFGHFLTHGISKGRALFR